MSPQPQRKGFSFGSGSPNQKFILFGGIAGAVLLIVIIVGLMSSSGKQNATPMLSVVQAQQEIMRVADAGAKNANSSNLQNFAVTTSLSMATDQRQLLAYLAKQGFKPSEKDLSLSQNPQTDQALAAAQAANTYDTTFSSTMQSELTDYTAKLEAAYRATTLTTLRSLLQKDANNAHTLATQVSQPPSQ